MPRHTLQVSPVVRANSSALAAGYQPLNRISLTSRQRAFEPTARVGHVPTGSSTPDPHRRAPLERASVREKKTERRTIRGWC